MFLHATGFNALTYRHILAPLARDWRILAVDQRGHGATTLTAAPDSLGDWCGYRDDLLALRETLDINNVVLAGHSMGGTVALLAAAAEPRFARRLMLFDPVILALHFSAFEGPFALAEGAARRRAVYANRTEVFGSYRGRGAFVGWPDDMLRDYIEDGFRELPSGDVALACEPSWEASTYRAQRHDSRAAFASARCPMDILVPEFNSACRFDPVAESAAAATSMEMDRIRGAGHFLPMERPELAREALMMAMSRG